MRAWLIAALLAAPADALGAPKRNPSARSPLEGEEPPASASPDAPALARAGLEFSIALNRALPVKDSNAFFSPYSITAAFAMAMAGARGETYDELGRALKLDLPRARLLAGLEAQERDLSGQSGVRLKIAGALWPSADQRLLPSFVEDVRRAFGASPRTLDYAKPDAVDTINDWVSRRTDGRIRKLFRRLSPATKLVLANAVYFKGDWARQFDAAHTRTEAFTSYGGKTSRVPLMRAELSALYADAGDVQVAELPYKGGRFAMLVALPKNADGLPAVEAALDAATIAGWIGRLREEPLDLKLPKFTLAERLDLRPLMEALGAGRLFDPGGADLSGISGRRDLFVDQAVHQAFVLVNEEGTEAAAATGLAMSRGAAMTRRTEFFADRPFLFFIRDRRTGAVLFMGRLVSP